MVYRAYSEILFARTEPEATADRDVSLTPNQFES